MEYSLKRLVKGLASSREGARQGFALALTEVAFPATFLTPLKKFYFSDSEGIRFDRWWQNRTSFVGTPPFELRDAWQSTFFFSDI